MPVSFTSHNIRLDDGSYTKPDVGYSMDLHPWFLAAKRTLDAVFPGDKRHLRIADLGCLEGGYTVEFARLGLDALGIEVRRSNLVNCLQVKDDVGLPNLAFAHDDAWNLDNHGTFDIVFCSGLLYHLDRPRQFVDLMFKACRRL